MKLNQKLILGLSFVCVILSTFVNTNDNLNLSYSSVQSVVTLNGGAQNRSSENTIIPQAREMLIKHFPDWEERMNYQKKQEKIYRSGLARIAGSKRVRLKVKLTKQ